MTEEAEIGLGTCSKARCAIPARLLWKWADHLFFLPYLLQPIEHRDEEAHIRQSLVVQVSDPLHQFWGWWHFGEDREKLS